MKKLIPLFLTMSILFSGCAFWVKDLDNSDYNYNEIPLYMISIGNSKIEVINALGKPANVIGAKQFGANTVEVWSYVKWKAVMGPDYIEETYWLYFWNGKLQQWGRPGDWQKEADKIYELRIR